MNGMQARLPCFIVVLGSTLGGVVLAAENPVVAEGRQLYEEYNCGECHGADGKSGKTAKVPPLAGMRMDDIYLKTKRYIESSAHEDVLRGCGEVPNHVQIKRIAEYVATLPR
jgi:cytochrome c553